MNWPEQYLGIPFRDRGSTRDGCDCWGLVRLIYFEQLGSDLPEFDEIAVGAVRDKLRAIRAAVEGGDFCREIRAGEERAFDWVLMRGQVRHDGQLHGAEIHIGCVVAPGTLIHIEAGSEVTIVDYRSHPRVRNRVVGFFRWAGTEHE